ncbi:MAG: hypothetical protein PHQ22_05495 [Sulfuricurvum sp.]|nr:hypothetical protein [Sulfuricurvum sp.]MDD5386630.1 hypothetical protein [Sulfuricurvum sp.]
MKKIIIMGMSVFVLMVFANEREKVEKKVLQQKQVNTKVQEKIFAKQEVKIKRQSYPRGNIVTH